MYMTGSLLITVGQAAGNAPRGIPWLWIGIGLAVLVVAVVVLFLLRAGRELEAEIRLVVTKGQQSGEALRIVSAYATIGSENDNDLIIADDKVSQHHARFSFRKGTLTVADANSLYGTFLNGERVEEAACAHGDVLRLGTQFECRIEIGSP
jgi:pSer/pThr/pTyr-binding forkhead associated (FHA) protein